MSKPNVLLVEDDASLRRAMKAYLERSGYDVVEAGCGRTMAGEIRKSKVDLVLLDNLLPDAKGVDLIPEIKRHTNAPIIIVSAEDDTVDKVLGLEMGADDYLCKPVELRELAARVKAGIRRFKASNGNPAQVAKGDVPVRVGFGKWIMDRSKYKVVDRHGNDSGLTTREFLLLDALVASAGKVLTREQLFVVVRDSDSDVTDRAVDVQITRIRQKICEDARRPTMIKTVRGIGYIFESAVEIPDQ